MELFIEQPEDSLKDHDSDKANDIEEAYQRGSKARL
jgi:hypothetical protein